MRLRIAKILLALAAPMVFLAIAEMTLRIATSGHVYFTESNPHYLDTNGWMRLRPGMATWWYGCFYPVNANGFRMPSEIPAKSGHRVLALGDSITLGMGVTRPEDTWPLKLGRIVREKTQRPADVINSGIQGWNLLIRENQGRIVPGQFVSFLANEARAFEPDVVVYCICMNDIPSQVDVLFETDNAKNKKTFKLFPERCREFLKRKAVYRLARDWFREKKFTSLDFSSSSPDADNPAIWNMTTDELKRLRQAAESQGASLMAILVPYSYQLLTANRDLLRINDHWHKCLAEAHIPYTDLTGKLNEQNVLMYYVLGDYIHPNAKGHELIAQAAWDLAKDQLMESAVTQAVTEQ